MKRRGDWNMQSKDEIRAVLEKWNRAWNEHDLEGVTGLFHEDILFNNWTGGRVQGKKALRKAWEPWLHCERRQYDQNDGFAF